MKDVQHKLFPVLTTDRLILRQLAQDDDQEIFELRTDTRVNAYLDRPRSKSIEEARAFIMKINEGIQQGQNIYWVLCTRESSKLMGAIGLWNFSDDRTTAEIGYELLPRYQQQGFMQEALQPVIQYGFNTLQLKAIMAFTHKDNEPSARLLHKNGFKPTNAPAGEDIGDGLVYKLSK